MGVVRWLVIVVVVFVAMAIWGPAGCQGNTCSDRDRLEQYC